MYISIILFILGFALLIKGADILVDGASSIAHKFGVSSFFIGLTIIAFGTSAPELVISSLASAKGEPGIALGNIIGANIANSLLILGIAAIIAPLLVRRSTIRKEIPLLLLSILAVGILANDFLLDGAGSDRLSRIDGLILLLFFGIFIFYSFGISREKENILQKTVGELKSQEPKEYGNFSSFFMILGGLAALGLGANWIVAGAVAFAEALKVPESLIGLTIVSLGTTLPELTASAVASFKGRSDIAVGNVIGSNIFNLLWVLGISSIIRPIEFERALNFNLAFLFIVTTLIVFLIYFGKKNALVRWEGWVLSGLYLLFMVFAVYLGTI